MLDVPERLYSLLQTAWSACDRKVQLWRHRTLHISNKEELQSVIAAGKLSQLGIIVLPRSAPDVGSIWPAEHHSKLLAELQLSVKGKHSTIFIIASQQQPQAAVQSKHHKAPVFSKDKKHLTRLAILTGSPPSVCITQLWTVEWPALAELHMSNSKLDTTAVTQLVGALSLQLKILMLSNNQLKRAVIKILLKARWPKLQKLTLDSTYTLDINFAPKHGNCPSLNELTLSYLRLDSVKRLATEFAPRLQMLSLDCGINPAAVSELASLAWPRLELLSLWRSALGSEAIQMLTKAALPQLKFLSLQHNEVNSAAMRHLVQADWPQLQHLDLSGNCLDAIAMKHLSTGRWPKLEALHLQVNAIGAQGYSHLTRVAWPELRHLSLDKSEACPATFSALSLDVSVLPEVARLSTDSNVVTFAFDTSTFQAWSALLKVSFQSVTTCQSREVIRMAERQVIDLKQQLLEHELANASQAVEHNVVMLEQTTEGLHTRQALHWRFIAIVSGNRTKIWKYVFQPLGMCVLCFAVLFGYI